jgi:hypothetical protein
MSSCNVRWKGTAGVFSYFGSGVVRPSSCNWRLALSFRAGRFSRCGSGTGATIGDACSTEGLAYRGLYMRTVFSLAARMIVVFRLQGGRLPWSLFRCAITHWRAVPEQRGIEQHELHIAYINQAAVRVTMDHRDVQQGVLEWCALPL